MMIVSHDKTNDKYGIIGMTVDDLIELSNVLESCQLPQKRIFHFIKRDIDIALENRNKVKKNADK